jgi:Tol biopolymer transport system component
LARGRGRGNLKQLSNGNFDHYPVCSPDAQWVYYLNGGIGQLMRVPIDGGAAQKVTDVPIVSRYDVSPDGSTVAFVMVDHTDGHDLNLALVATDTGKVRKLLKFERSPGDLIRFSRDGKAMVYTVRENGVDNLWEQPLDDSPGKQITSFKSESINDFQWSPDGSRLALVQGHNDSDVVLMRSQR